MLRGLLRRLMHSPWLLGLLSCLVVALSTSLLAHYTWQADIRSERAEFRETIAGVTDHIETKVRTYEQLIQAMALIANERGLEAASRDWSELCGHLMPLSGGSSLVSLSLVRYVAKRDPYPAAIYSSEHMATSLPDFEAPLLSIDRDAAVRSMIGYNLNVDSIRREALEAARDSGRVAVTSPIVLSRDTHTGAAMSFLLIAPIYAGGSVDTQAARRAAIRGYVVAAYRMQDLISLMLPRLAERSALRISDTSDDYSPLIYFERNVIRPAALFRDTHGLLIADRFWQLAYATTPEYEAQLKKRHSLRILAVGALLALLVGVLVWLLARSWRHAESRVRGVAGELRRYQTLLRTVLDVIPEPVLVKDRDYKLIMVNQAYAKRAGLPIEQLIGKETREFMPAEIAERLFVADQAVFESRQDQVFELSMPNRALNSVRNYIVTKRFSHDVDGHPIIVGIHSDVTELRRKIAEFAAVIEQTPLVAVQGFDRNCVLTHWNAASESLFSWPASRAIGSRLQDLLLERRLQRLFETAVETAWCEQRAFGPRELDLRLPDGRRLRLLLTLFPVVVEGVVLEIFSMAVDVSARHAAERELALHRDHLQSLVDERTAGLLRTQHELERALQVRSEFLANMSHELRTPMHAVLSFARLGEERAGAESRLRDYFSRIALSGERLLGLINDLLDLSKLEAGKRVLHKQSVDMVRLVHEVGAEMQPLIEDKQLKLKLSAPCAPMTALGDPEQLRQMLSNLLANAIRFSAADSAIEIALVPGHISLGHRPGAQAALPAIVLQVSDRGPGIPPDELELIFDKFMQSSATRSGAGGTGLGLSICREIVHAHQGTITARNREGGGAVFEVLLPCEPPHPHEQSV